MAQYKVEFCYFILYFPEKEGGPSKSNELQNDLAENTKNNGSSHATESLTTFFANFATLFLDPRLDLLSNAREFAPGAREMLVSTIRALELQSEMP